MLNRLDGLMKEIDGNGCIAPGKHASSSLFTRDDVVGMARRVLTPGPIHHLCLRRINESCHGSGAGDAV